MGRVSDSGSGILKIGAVKTFGDWTYVGDEYVSVCFDTSRLSRDLLRAVEHFKNSSDPISVHLPNEKLPSDGLIVGYEQKDHQTVFFVKRTLEAV